ncbi:MAG: hypothetical protein GXP61_00420 [Epsilonproteobacteria bacterium]|nr:hypothetical protein [Campylobacterota bacterium]
MTRRKDNKRRKVMIVILFVVIILGAAAFLTYRYMVLQNDINSKVSYSEDIIHKDFNSNIEDVKREYSRKVDSLLSIDGVKKAFASRDRQKLYELVKARYKKYKNSDPFLKIMSFRLTDGSTFLRVHKPQMYGDKLNKRRTIIIDTNRLQKRLYGFEIGKLQMSYRVVTPIFYKNKYVGLVEVGILPKEFTSSISDIFHIRNALVVNTAGTSVSLAKKQYLQEDGFSLVGSDPMFKKIFELSNTKYKGKKSFFFTYDENKKDYLVENNLNLLNQNKKVVAKILIAYDITTLQADNNNFEQEAGIFALLVVIFLSALLQFFW